MKCIAYFITALFILLSCSADSFAAEHEDLLTGNVYGKFNYYSNAEMYTDTSTNGEYVITADNGIQISISSDIFELMLVVHQITENDKECYAWISSRVSQEASDFIPYDIFFIDADGNRIELPDEAVISIKVPDSINSIIGLSFDGDITNIPYSCKNGSLNFTPVTFGNYYVLCKKVKEQTSPKTGDDSWICILMIVTAISEASFICIYKKKNKNYV